MYPLRSVSRHSPTLLNTRSSQKSRIREGNRQYTRRSCKSTPRGTSKTTTNKLPDSSTHTDLPHVYGYHHAQSSNCLHHPGVAQSCVDLKGVHYNNLCTYPSNTPVHQIHQHCDAFCVTPCCLPRDIYGHDVLRRRISIGRTYDSATPSISSRGYNNNLLINMDTSILKVHLPASGFNVVKCGDATDVKVSTSSRKQFI